MIEYIDPYGNVKGYHLDTPVKVVQEDMKKPADVRYKLSIYPEGYIEKRSDNGEVHLIFDEKESWDEYKRKEWYFCRKEHDAYLISPHENKIFYRDEFYKKRVLFSKQQNFIPKKGNKKEWIREIVNVDTKILA